MTFCAETGLAMESIPHRLRERIKDGECVLFLGSGASRDAGGPTGADLATLLANQFSKIDIPTQDLTRFSGILTSLPDIDREDVDRAIVSVLTRLEPSEAHRVIPTLPWRAIFTTNYDRLIEVSYDSLQAAAGIRPVQELQVILRPEDQVSLVDRSRLGLFKLHGCVSSIGAGNPLVLTESDFRATYRRRGKMLRFLKSLAKEHALVFVGYSFSDQTINSLLEELDKESPYNSHRHMYLVSPTLTASEKSFFEARNFECIPSSFRDFFLSLAAYFSNEDRKAFYSRRLRPIREPNGRAITLPNQLRVSLDTQLDPISTEVYPQTDARQFLSGLPPTPGDLRNGNDIQRRQQVDLFQLMEHELDNVEYLRPLVMIVGSGGAGKSTLAARVAYELAERERALVFLLKSNHFWKQEEIVELARLAQIPTVFVCDSLELHARYKALRDLRMALSAARCRSVLLASCQKAIWHDLERLYPQQGALVFDATDTLNENEVRSLIEKLANHGILEIGGRKGLVRQAQRVMQESDGNLVVAMLQLVKNGRFQEIVLSEYYNISDRAKKAYEYVALLHQHGISIPDYLLNEVAVGDWNSFSQEVVALESDLVIVQDLNFGSGRICFRTRHPEIARVIVETILHRHEDRIRMYRRLISSLGGSDEDRSFLLDLLRSKSVRTDIREDKFVEEFFDKSLDLFPYDLAFILHLGKFEISAGKLDRARELLQWGRSIAPRDSYIIHQLGVCEERRAEKAENSFVRDSRLREAQSLYRDKQKLDPMSHYGFSFESRLLCKWSQRMEGEQRLDMISAAMDAIRRGKELVREDDLGVLQECEIEIDSLLGDHDKALRRIEELEASQGLRYASSYHLASLVHMTEGRQEEALGLIEKGLSNFPGDKRLISLVLEIFEKSFYKPEIRERSRQFVAIDSIGDATDIRLLFLCGVLEFYDQSFARSRATFSNLRTLFNSTLSDQPCRFWPARAQVLDFEYPRELG